MADVFLSAPVHRVTTEGEGWHLAESLSLEGLHYFGPRTPVGWQVQSGGGGVITSHSQPVHAAFLPLPSCLAISNLAPFLFDW